jgi:hypothetical protein
MTNHHHPIIIAGVLGALSLAPPALAGQPPRSDLNPPPPDIYTCQATGTQTICRASERLHEDPVVTDVDCPGFPIVDQGDVRTEFTRRYDSDGNFVERVRHETWTNAFWSNPLNGNTIPYTQRGITTDRATVPGDLDSIRETLTGENIYTDPVTNKKVMKVAGRVVFAPDGSLESSSGQQPFIERFVFGDPSAFAALCGALARPPQP